MTQQLPNNIPDLLDLIRLVYDYRLNEFGPVAGGVFWKGHDDQILRLELLLQAISAKDLKAPVSINDLGCGYGALFDLISAEPMMSLGTYTGYDISEKMVRAAQSKINDPRATFITSPIATKTANYSFVSGTYNMSMGAPKSLWTHYIKTSLKSLWDKTDTAMGFNLLDDTGAEKLSDLFYANKKEFIKFAMTLSPEIEILDDYPLPEFTIFVKRVDGPK